MRRYIGVKGMLLYVINAVIELGLSFTLALSVIVCLSPSSGVCLDRCMTYTYVNH